MASFGKVLDLLDERYLELQDVIGNVQPLPTLVPYEDYTQNVLVYRMDTNHELFMALIQDFTARDAQQKGKELWTWCVQWEVDNGASSRSIPSPKRARLDIEQPTAQTDEPQQTQRQAPIIDVFGRRVLDPELMREEDMMRILIDIVQVDSSLVPNFIEFLYRWIDFYEGDGKALKAALKWEIPSLWDFEYHPLTLPVDVKDRMENEKLIKSMADGAIKDREMGEPDRGLSKNSRVEELAQGSPAKKMREKPDLAALERYIEESERLQYREVKYGIQPPKMHQPLPPLINIPRDQAKRVKYYAACFKSRQRALVLLIEAGISMQQIGNYAKLQEAHPRDTSQDGDPRTLKGLQNYHKDARAAQEHYLMKEKQQLQREKQKESSISHKLAIEAQLAAEKGVSEGSSGVPLIPLTPSYESSARRPDMAAAMLAKLKVMRANGEERINVVPTPLVGCMKSKLFEGAKDRQTLNAMGRPGEAKRKPCEPVSCCEDRSDSRSEDDDDNDENNQPAPPVPRSNLPQPSLPFPRLPLRPVADSGQPVEPEHTQNFAMPGPTRPGPTHNAPVFAHVAGYMRNLTAEQSQRLFPLLNPGARQAAAIGLGLQATISPSPVPTNTSARLIANGISGIIPPSDFSQTGSTFQAHNISPATGSGAGQHRHTLMPFLPPHPRPPPTAMPSPQASCNWPFGQNSPYGSQLAHPGSTFLQMPSDLDGGRASSRNPGHPSNVEELLALRHQQEASAQAQVSLRSSIPSQSALPRPALQPPRPFPHPQQGFLQQPTQLPSRPTPPQIQISPPLFSPSGPTLSPPRRGIQRNAPSSLHFIPPTSPSPFSSLAPSLLATTPFAASPHGIPIQIYLPGIVMPGNGVGPDGARLGNAGAIETDAFLVGYTRPGSGKIVLSKAIFLPVGVWTNTLTRVRKGAYTVLETYAPSPSHPKLKGKGPVYASPGVKSAHEVVYAKLAQAYGVMKSSTRREEELTKRWRATRGPMTQQDRGAVWEGWAVCLDCGIEMNAQEREAALLSNVLVDAGVDRMVGADNEEAERRRREMEELMEEDEDEDEEMED